MRNFVYHKDLASGRWATFSLSQQLGNIGSEVHRAAKAEGKDEKQFLGAVERALELFDLTLEDMRWKGRFWEISRAREAFCDAVSGGKLYNSTLDGLDKYFLHFAMAARK